MSALTRVARFDEDDNDVAYLSVDLDTLDDVARAQLRPLRDDEDNDPLDRFGRPRDPSYPAAPEVAGEPVDPGYEVKTVAELRDEVTRRNADRPEDDHVAVEPPGNKAELVAALEADDLP